VPKRTEADFQAWRDQQAWTEDKYAHFDRGERMPPHWRPRLRPPAGSAALTIRSSCPTVLSCDLPQVAF
jgi:hypothetical protein